jgi:hypothetical protein
MLYGQGNWYRLNNLRGAEPTVNRAGLRLESHREEVTAGESNPVQAPVPLRNAGVEPAAQTSRSSLYAATTKLDQ